MTSTDDDLGSDGYAAVRHEVSGEIRRTQLDAIRRSNALVIDLYARIGRVIVAGQYDDGYALARRAGPVEPVQQCIATRAGHQRQQLASRSPGWATSRPRPRPRPTGCTSLELKSRTGPGDLSHNLLDNCTRAQPTPECGHTVRPQHHSGGHPTTASSGS